MRVHKERLRGRVARLGVRGLCQWRRGGILSQRRARGSGGVRVRGKGFLHVCIGPALQASDVQPRPCGGQMGPGLCIHLHAMPWLYKDAMRLPHRRRQWVHRREQGACATAPFVRLASLAERQSDTFSVPDAPEACMKPAPAMHRVGVDREREMARRRRSPLVSVFVTVVWNMHRGYSHQK